MDILDADRERCAALLEHSCAFAMAYVPKLGYRAVERIILENRGDPEKVRKALEGC